MPFLEIVSSPPEPHLAERLAELALMAHNAGYIDVVDWTSSELRGYRGGVPVYRHVRGTPVGLHPTKGWVQLYPPDRVPLRISTTYGIRQGIGELEAAIAQAVGGKAYVQYSDNETGLINNASGLRFSQMASCVDVSVLDHVLTRVGSLATNWINEIRASMPFAPSPDSGPLAPPAA